MDQAAKRVSRTALAPAGLLALTLAGCGSPEAEQKARTGGQVAETPPTQFARVGPDEVRHGERLARVLGCLGCHGEDLTGVDWSEPGFGRLWTANLTRALAGYDDTQLARTIAGGVRPDGSELWEMPSHLFTALTRKDMAALIFYLRTRPPAGVSRPRPVFEEGARREIAAGTFKSSPVQVREQGGRGPPDAGPGHALARYITRSTCAECHGMDLRGGQPNAEATRRPDLRIAAAYERAAFHRLLRTGIAAGERELGLMSDVARDRYAHLTVAEVDAVYDYLRALSESEQAGAQR